MTSLQSPIPAASAPSSRLSALILRVTAALIAVRRARIHRREVTDVLRLDDHMLKDIGLTRTDVLNALAGPSSIDPSVVLRLRRGEDRLRPCDREAQVGRLMRGSRRRFLSARSEPDLQAVA